jgi:hypothetical protein
MEHSHNRPIPIVPVTIIITVAIRPVGVDSGRWARGRRLRQFEDVVGFGRLVDDDDSLHVLVELAHRELHIIQHSFHRWLPILIGCGHLLGALRRSSK